MILARLWHAIKRACTPNWDEGEAVLPFGLASMIDPSENAVIEAARCKQQEDEKQDDERDVDSVVRTKTD